MTTGSSSDNNKRSSLAQNYFGSVLSLNRLVLHQTVLQQFLPLLLSIPSLDRYAPSLRGRFQRQPGNAVEDLLDYVRKDLDDIDMWKEFIKALDDRNLEARKLFVKDEELQSRDTAIFSPIQSFINTFCFPSSAHRTASHAPLYK